MKKVPVFIIPLAVFAVVLAYFIWSTRPTVSVVRSMDELRNQQPIELPDGVTIRLGISNSESYVGAGRLLYCLATGLKGKMEEESGQLRLGPVKYSVLRPGDVVKPAGSNTLKPWQWGKKKKKNAEGYSAWSGIELKPTDEILFCATVRTAQAGSYRIEFANLQGEELGFAIITAGNEDLHPWQPADIQYQNDHFVFANDPKGCAALPSMCGLFPAFSAAKLPRLTVGADDPNGRTFSISLKDDSLTMEFPEPVEYHCPLDWNFLCRWWVNGVPVVPSKWQSGFGRIDGHIGRERILQWKFALNAKKLGSATGDSVGLQIMYSSWPWTYIGLSEHSGGSLEPAQILVSNRIDFKYEGK